LQLVAGTHEDDGRFEFFALSFGPTFLASDDHQIEESCYLIDHFNSRHLRHLELSYQQINSLQTLLLQRVSHNEVDGGHAAREELDLSLAAKVDKEQLSCFKVH